MTKIGIAHRFLKLIREWIPALGWTAVFVILLIVCVNIEFKFLLIPCSSKETADTINKIVLALFYSLIAAVIFHLIVNVYPHNKRKNMLKPLLYNNLFSIIETIRLCKEGIMPLASVCDKKYSKADYAQIFDDMNFHEDSFIGRAKTKLEYYEELRKRIIKKAHLTLSYREYLNDEQFVFLQNILNSLFIIQGIDVHPDLEPEERRRDESNQYEIGECIFDLYESSKIIMQNITK